LPQLSGSCHCGAVRFSVFSRAAVPFMRCYCSICRKTAGGGGYAINIMGEAATLESKGRSRIYRARRGGAERHFCPKCASALWLWDRRWPEWVYPFASAIDTRLPTPSRDEIGFLISSFNDMTQRLSAARRQASLSQALVEAERANLDWKAPWVRVPRGPGEKRFGGFSRESIIGWHRKRGLAR